MATGPPPRNLPASVSHRRGRPQHQEYDVGEVDVAALPSFQQHSDSFGFDGYDNGSAPSVPIDSVPSYILPDMVKDFIVYFYRKLHERSVYEIQSIYENSFGKLTERFFKETSWPDPNLIAPLVNNDPITLILYKELYFRHIYSKMQPTLEQRFDSYENYCDLFNYVLDSDAPVPLELPNRWLWDIIDEFIYQFQSFTQYRTMLTNKTPEEIQALKDHPQIWNVHIVLNVLHSLVEKSNIQEQLEYYQQGEDPLEIAGEFGSTPLYKMLGYFSLVGLLRLHVLLGDYYQALKVLEHIELNKKGLYSRVAACQITIYYYVGFAYMMMRRYQDSVRTFSNILFYILKTQNFHFTKSAGFDEMMKKRDQLYNLLAIAMTLCPQRIDEAVHAQLLEKCSERMVRMQRSEESAFEEFFQYGCPKFLSPVAPDYDIQPASNYHMEPYRLQLKLFLNEIRQQSLLPTIRSYLKLYSTMPIEKLASFLSMDVETFRLHLHNYKHKTTSLVWNTGTALAGERMASSDVDFFIDRDMIHIADVKVARCYGEYFIHQINKMVANI